MSVPLTEEQFRANASECGNNIQTALRLAADACHDHAGNSKANLSADGGSSLLDYLNTVDTGIRTAVNKEDPPAFVPTAETFLSKSGQPTAAIHNYLKNSGHHKSAQVMLRSAGRDMSAIFAKLQENGVTAAIVDSYTTNPYKYNFGGTGFNHLDTITTRMDAASKLTDIPADMAKQNSDYYTTPFTVYSFYGPYSHTYEVDSDGANRIKIASGSGGVRVIHMRSPKGFSVNDINKALGLPAPRGSVASSSSAITFLAENPAGTVVPVTASDLTPKEKADCMLVKQITDYGQFYQATHLTRTGGIKTALITVDKYFVDIMESCEELQGGFVVVMDKQESQLLCLNPAFHIDPNAQKSAIIANLATLIPVDAAGTGLYTISDGGIISTVASIRDTQRARIDAVLRNETLYHDPFTFIFQYELQHLKDELDTYLTRINTILTAVLNGSLTVDNFVESLDQDSKLFINNLSTLTVEQVAASKVDTMSSIIEEYYALFKSINTLKTQIIKNNISEEEFAEQVTRTIYDFVMGRAFTYDVDNTLRLKLVGIWLSYVETQAKQKYTIYNKLALLDSSGVSANAYLYANRIHYVAKQTVSMYNFVASTGNMLDSEPTPINPASIVAVSLTGASGRLARATAASPSKIGDVDLLSDAVADIELGKTPADAAYRSAAGATVNMMDRKKNTIDYITEIYNTIVTDRVHVPASAPKIKVLSIATKAAAKQTLVKVAEYKKKLDKLVKSADESSPLDPTQLGRARAYVRKTVAEAKRAATGLASSRKSLREEWEATRGIATKKMTAPALPTQGGGGDPTEEQGDAIVTLYNASDDEIGRLLDLVGTGGYSLESEEAIRALVGKLSAVTTLPEFFSLFLDILNALRIDAELREFLEEYDDIYSDLQSLFFVYTDNLLDEEASVEDVVLIESLIIKQLLSHMLYVEYASVLFESISSGDRNTILSTLLTVISAETVDTMASLTRQDRNSLRGKPLRTGTPLTSDEKARLAELNAGISELSSSSAAPAVVSGPRRMTIANIRGAAAAEAAEQRARVEAETGVRQGVVYSTSSDKTSSPTPQRAGSRRATRGRRHIRRTRRRIDRSRRKRTRKQSS